MGAQTTVVAGVPEPTVPLLPSGLLCQASSRDLFVTCAGSKVIVRLDTAKRRVVGHVPMLEASGGLAISADGERLLIACGAPEGKLSVIDLAGHDTIGNTVVGHSPAALVASPDGKVL